MTEKRVYLASEGPFIYDDTEDLDEYEGIFTDRKQAALTSDGQILLIGGGDITLEGSDSTPAKLIFSNTALDRYTNIAGRADSRTLCIYPDTDQTGSFVIGQTVAATHKKPQSIELYCGSNGITLRVYNSSNTYYTEFAIAASSSANNKIHFLETGLQTYIDKALDIGTNTYAFDDVYADDFQNVADFPFLDDRDDLAAIEQIKGSGKMDPRTGLEIIDDDTLPVWLVSKCKDTGEILKDSDGKPFIALKNITGLLMGACRQLNKKNIDLEKRVDDLEAKLSAIVKNLQQGKNNA